MAIFLLLSCDLFFNGHFLFLPSPPVSMVKPLYAVFMFMKVCCTVYMSYGNLLPFWDAVAPAHSYSDMMEMCSSNSLICLPPSLSLLMALDLSLHSGKRRTASLCVPIAFWESTCIDAAWPNEPLWWLLLLLLWGIESGFDAFCIRFPEPYLAPHEPEPQAKEFARSFWFDLIWLHLSMRDGQPKSSVRFEVKVHLRQTTVYCDG